MKPGDPSRGRAAMPPRTMLHLYRVRLRAHLAHELLAGAGVAVAVALVFATLVADRSVAGSAGEVAHALAGRARLQLSARGPDGFPEGTLRRVERLSGVAQVAGLLEQRASVRVPGRPDATVELVGFDPGLVELDGLAKTLPHAVLSPRGAGITAATARDLGLPDGDTVRPSVTLMLRGDRHRMSVPAVLGRRQLGVLADAHLLIMPLGRLQALAGLAHRLTRILVVPAPGRDAAVRAQLQALAGARLTVASADNDVALLHQALRPGSQASTLFAAISALLGLLFAFTALLLALPERRLAIAELSLEGARRSAIVRLVLFESLCLGVLASLLGIVCGLLSLRAFGPSTGYLARAFTLGGGEVVGSTPLLGALLVGFTATALAALALLRDRRSTAAAEHGSLEAVPGAVLDARMRRPISSATLALVVLAGALFALAPSAAILTCALLALATVLAIPLVLAAGLGIAGALVRRRDGPPLLAVVLTSLRATELRSLALAATGAVAIFGSAALGGSRDDLLAGIDAFAADYAAGADIWVVSPGDNQAVDPFSGGRLTARLAELPGVADVRSFQGGFLDLDGRRVWVLAWPRTGALPLLAGQIVRGTRAGAVARLRRGGWITVSEQIARARGLDVGDRLSLPTPTGSVVLRVAATTTNFGWSPGAMLLDTADYAHAWATRAPTALGVTLAPGANAAAVRVEITNALGRRGGLQVLAKRSLAARIDASAGEGLSQLGQIATMLMLAAILALTAALASGVWQARRALAALRLEGVPPAQLRRMLAIEGGLILAGGCCTGVLAGVCGRTVIDGYLRGVTGFPVLGSAALLPLEILAATLLIVLLVAAVPGWLASRVPATLAFDE